MCTHYLIVHPTFAKYQQCPTSGGSIKTFVLTVTVGHVIWIVIKTRNVGHRPSVCSLTCKLMMISEAYQNLTYQKYAE